nr:MAG TPA: Hydantoinase/oxoprolinase [Caudoviricetes sp.]
MQRVFSHWTDKRIGIDTGGAKMKNLVSAFYKKIIGGWSC